MKNKKEKTHEHHFGPKDLHVDKPGVSESEDNSATSPEKELVSEWPYGHFHPHSEKKNRKRTTTK